MPRKKQSPKYPGVIQTVPLKVTNTSREDFRDTLNNIPFLGYEVEQLTDGRTICITKPGGKRSFGYMAIHDFMVWIYDCRTMIRWRISHSEIFEDIQKKIDANPIEGQRVVQALIRVYHGEEPDLVLTSESNLGLGLPGETTEAILKAYKWIWGQEDCNYPTGDGRYLSMKEIEKISGLKS